MRLKNELWAGKGAHRNFQIGMHTLLRNGKMATCRRAHDSLPRNLPLYYNKSLKKLLRDQIVFKVGSIKLQSYASLCTTGPALLIS